MCISGNLTWFTLIGYCERKWHCDTLLFATLHPWTPYLTKLTELNMIGLGDDWKYNTEYTFQSQTCGCISDLTWHFHIKRGGSRWPGCGCMGAFFILLFIYILFILFSSMHASTLSHSPNYWIHQLSFCRRCLAARDHIPYMQGVGQPRTKRPTPCVSKLRVVDKMGGKLW